MTKATGERLSLTEFAAAARRSTSGRSWMEELPPDVLEECKAGWRAGLRARPIVDWLKALGYKEATPGRVGWLEKHADE